MKLSVRRLRRGACAVVWIPALFAVFFALGLARPWESGPIGRRPPAGADTTTGDERLLVYIGSSTCGPSNDDSLPALVATLRVRVRAWAQRDRRRFVVVGIAKDRDVRSGLHHLARFGDFDEVTTGRNWANMGVLKYVYRDLPGPGATPQVLVVDRHLTNEIGGVEVRNEVVRIRRVGLREVSEWAAAKDDRLPDAEDSGANL